MLFNTAPFVVFFLVVFAIVRSVPRRAQLSVLIAASVLFYGLWIPTYLLLLVAEIGVNYTLLRAMSRSARPRIYLVASIVFTLGLLAFFKYAAMIVETAAPILELTTGFRPPLPDILLPLGISFYSFQILALSIDTYRGQIEPVRSLPRYALFVGFFPQLIAGPILRGHEFLPQIERGGDPRRSRTRRGLWLIASGVTKKMILADFLLAPFVDSVFDVPGVGSAPYHLLAIYGFAFQIYFDFSGYTDIARGLACLLGFDFPLNFAEPYLARSIGEFWERWHITLSTWFRDYVFMPLAFSQPMRARASITTVLYISLAITWTLVGLWHGAKWNFVIWGGYQAVLLIGARALRPWVTRATRRAKALGSDAVPGWIGDAAWVALTFHAVVFGLVFFRAPTLAEAMTYIGALFSGSYLVAWPLAPLAVVILCAALHGLERYARPRLPRLQRALSTSWWGAAIEGATFGLLFGLAIAVAGAGGEFIYFQF